MAFTWENGDLINLEIIVGYLQKHTVYIKEKDIVVRINKGKKIKVI